MSNRQNADDKITARRSTYKPWQRWLYTIRRQIVFLLFLVPGLALLTYLDPMEEQNTLIILLVTRACRLALGMMMAVLFMKFAFPKIGLQSEIVEEHNYAAALIMGAIIIAANL